MRRTIILLICFLIFSNCRKEDDIIIDKKTGLITSISPIWKYNLHNQEPTSNSIINAHLITEDKVIVATTNGYNNRFINGLELETGSELWQWNDVYQNPTEYLDIEYAHIYNNNMYYHVGTRRYNININTGNTEWKLRTDTTYSGDLVGCKEEVYLVGQIENSKTGYTTFEGLIMNMNSGNIRRSIVPEFDSSYVSPRNSIGDVTHLSPVNDGSEYIVVSYVEPLPNWNLNSFLGLYNVKTEEWVYDRILLTQPLQNTSVYHIPVIYDDKIYLNVGRELGCYDLWTGQKVWQRKFPLDFLFSGFIVEDDMMIANCETGVLYCLQASNGGIIHEVKTAGTSSPLRYLNGIVYLSGGSTGDIYAFDTQEGKMVWELNAELYDDGSKSFKPDIYVSPGKEGKKGKVIVCTHTVAYCLEAYR